MLKHSKTGDFMLKCEKKALGYISCIQMST